MGFTSASLVRRIFFKWNIAPDVQCYCPIILVKSQQFTSRSSTLRWKVWVPIVMWVAELLNGDLNWRIRKNIRMSDGQVNSEPYSYCQMFSGPAFKAYQALPNSVDLKEIQVTGLDVGPGRWDEAYWEYMFTKSKYFLQVSGIADGLHFKHCCYINQHYRNSTVVMVIANGLVPGHIQLPYVGLRVHVFRSCTL